MISKGATQSQIWEKKIRGTNWSQMQKKMITKGLTWS